MCNVNVIKLNYTQRWRVPQQNAANSYWLWLKESGISLIIRFERKKRKIDCCWIKYWSRRNSMHVEVNIRLFPTMKKNQQSGKQFWASFNAIISASIYIASSARSWNMNDMWNRLANVHILFRSTLYELIYEFLKTEPLKLEHQLYRCFVW